RELREVVEREQHRVLVALAAELAACRRGLRRRRCRLAAEQIATVVIIGASRRRAARRRGREQIAWIVLGRAAAAAEVVAAAEHRADGCRATAARDGSRGAARGNEACEHVDLRER